MIKVLITSNKGKFMSQYIWKMQNWQNFKYDRAKLIEPLSKARFLQGELIGKMSVLDIKLQTQAHSEMLIKETLETAKIEGIDLNIDSVRSSVAKKLGFPKGIEIKKDKLTDGLVEVLIDASQNYNAPLTLERLNGWHAALFPLGYSDIRKITAGDLRKGDIRVVSGYIGKEKTHFEAPPARTLQKNIRIFIDWFNNAKGEEGLLRAATAHLKFVTIHPYDDGNGRLSRAISDMAMAQDEKILFRSYSLSAQIMKERSSYYQILESVQKSQKDLTDWYEWFIKMFINALSNSKEIIAQAFFKASFWNKIKDIELNNRQRKVIQKLLDAGIDNFQGALTTKKYVSMTKTSSATAFREIEYMREKGIIKSTRKGRNVNYCLQEGRNK
jgi:Fic family protein